MNFVYGAILWGALACVAPVIIHLVMRTKPRPMILPTLRFVRKTHLASASKLRLRHLLLLAMRIFVIVLIAYLLARVFLPEFGKASRENVPTALVVVVDNSASMEYSLDKQTALARGKLIADEIVDTLPTGSQIAVMSTDGQNAAAGFLADIKLATGQIDDVPQGYGDSAIASVLAKAVNLAGQVDLPAREVMIVTDSTAGALRDLNLSKDTRGVRFTVVDCGPVQHENVTISLPRLSSPSVPVGGEVTLEFTLSSDGFGGEVELRVELAGQAVEERSLRIKPGEVRVVKIPLRPRLSGVLHGVAAIKSADGLRADNVRFFTLHVSPPVDVLFVTTPAGRDDRTAFLTGNAICPPNGSGNSGPVRRRIRPDEIVPEKLEKTGLVVLAGAAGLSEDNWKILEKYVRAGGSLWITAGPMLSADSYNSSAARRLMPAELADQEELSPAMAWQAVDTRLPMFKPFAPGLPEDANPPLSDLRFHRRFGIASLASDAAVEAKYADGVPALLSRDVGEGHIVFWNFSPTRSWSNMSQLAGQLVVLAQRTREILLRDESLQTLFPWGREIMLPLPAGSARPASAKGHHVGRDETFPVEIDFANRLAYVPANRLGGSTLTFIVNDEILQRGYSINVPPAESDLTRVEESEIFEKFPPGRVEIIRQAGERTSTGDPQRLDLDLLPIVLLLLLVLLTVESWFANRFYKRPSEENET